MLDSLLEAPMSGHLDFLTDREREVLSRVAAMPVQGTPGPRRDPLADFSPTVQDTLERAAREVTVHRHRNCLSELRDRLTGRRDDLAPWSEQFEVREAMSTRNA